MDTNRSTKPQGFPQPGARGSEERDAHVGWIFGIVTFLALAGVVIHFIIAGTFEGYQKSQPTTDQWKVSSRAQPLASAHPPFPKLQISPPVDLAKFRAREEAELNSYGWVDKKTGIVRIPIDRAMDLLLERGLATRSESNSANASPSAYQLIQQRTATNPP
jgi:hypothetical protein